VKIRMRVSISGARGDGAWPKPGEVMDVGETEAHELQQAGIADIVPDDATPEDHPEAREPDPEPEVETATVAVPAETASTAPGSTRRQRPGR
jgi:hypothetical protein